MKYIYRKIINNFIRLLVLLIIQLNYVLAEEDQQCKDDYLSDKIIVDKHNLMSNKLEQIPIIIEANKFSFNNKKLFLEGNVQLLYENSKINSDFLNIRLVQKKIFFDNPFIYSDYDQVISGHSAEINLENLDSIFNNVDFYIKDNNVIGSAKIIRFEKNKKLIKLKKTTYSTCKRYSEDWKLYAEDITIDQLNKFNIANDVKFFFRDIPILYIPHFSFPIGENKIRKSGFLMPIKGHSNISGFSLGIPYYWNISPNKDFTFTPYLTTKNGIMFNIEYRFLDHNYVGYANTEYLIKDLQNSKYHSYINLSDYGSLISNIYTKLVYESVSDDNYLMDVSKLNINDQNYLEKNLEMNYFGKNWHLLGRVQNNEIFYRLGYLNKNYKRLPQIVFNSQSSPIDNFLYKFHTEFVNFQKNNMINGMRLNILPSFSWNLNQDWIYINPSAAIYYTIYQIDDPDELINKLIIRTIPIISIDSRIFLEKKLNINNDLLQIDKQILEPRIFYLYIPYIDQNNIPIFDSNYLERDYDWLFLKNRFSGIDRLGDANHLIFALNSNFLNKNSSELLNISIGYLHQMQKNQVNIQENYNQDIDSSYLITQSKWNFLPKCYLQSILGVNTNSNNITYSSIDINYQYLPHHIARITYLFENDNKILNEQIRAIDISMFWPVNSNWRLIWRWNRALNIKMDMENMFGFEYENCCWSIRAAKRRSHNLVISDNHSLQTNFYLEFALKGLSEFSYTLEDYMKQPSLGL